MPFFGGATLMKDSSVVMDDLDLEGMAILESEAQPPLIVYANAPLPDTITGQGFEPVRWRLAQLVDRRCCFQLIQPHHRATLDSGRQSPRGTGREQPFGILVGKAPDHPVTPVVPVDAPPIVNI